MTVKGVGGRPIFDGRDEKIVIAKLEQVWAIGGSDVEAAFFADISPSSLCRYLVAHPDVSARKEALKARPVLLARQAVISSFDGHKIKNEAGDEVSAPRDADMALRFLERKQRDEFATKREIDASSMAPISITYVPAKRKDKECKPK